MRERFRGDERGQTLVVVALAMVVMVGMLALAVDVASWYQKRHQAQLAADAAALAAAHCLASTNCTSTAPGGDAALVATTYAAANGVPLTSTNQVSFDSSTVTVSETTPAPVFFGAVAGIHSVTASTAAAAKWSTTSSSACTTPGLGCYAIFASASVPITAGVSSCSTSSSSQPLPYGSGVYFNGAGDVVTGSVHSNASIYFNGGSQTLGPTTYGNGTGCQTKTGGSGDTFSSGPAAEAPITTWPDDYSQVLTACGGSGQVACTGPNGTPSYCTKSKASYTFGNGADAIATNNVYCATGTIGSTWSTPSGAQVTVSASDPTTWNGLIEFQSGTLGSSSTPIYGTWISGKIDVDHQAFLAPQSSTPGYPLFYSAGYGLCSSATDGAICMPGQNSQLTGALFAPNGEINFNGAGSTSNFLEGAYVNLTGGTFNGDGPTGNGGSGASPGTSQLVQ